MKQCSNCHQEKPLDDFYKATKCRTKDGVHSQCKICMREKERKRYYENPEKQKLKGRIRIRSGCSSYDYTKHMAKAAVRKAICNGVIIRPNRCSACGIECKPHGHHDNHKKKLAVIWLCPSCHAQRHVRLGRANIKEGHPLFK